MNKADPFWDPFFFDEHRLTNEQWEELLNPYPGKIIDIGNPIRGLPTFWSAVHPSFIPRKNRMNTIKELENELASIQKRTKQIELKIALLKNEHEVTTVPVHVNSTDIREATGGPSAYTWLVRSTYGGTVRVPIDMMSDKHIEQAIDWIEREGNASHRISLSYMLSVAQKRGLR